MDNKLTRDFAVKFNELNSDNQRYIIAIQQALAYAQSSASYMGVNDYGRRKRNSTRGTY